MTHASDAILVTGGAGFIGSHFARLAAETGSRVFVVDDLSGAPDFPPAHPSVEYINANVGDRGSLKQVLVKKKITAVVHFAGKICVGESVSNPALYFDHNVTRTLALLDAVRDVGPPVVVLSSSAAVYGVPDNVPITETSRYAPVNPYGATKLAAEHALASYGAAHGISWAALRYFNAAGAHPDGTLRERHEPETHLIPLAIDAVLGRLSSISVFGTDYPTKDGTCVRDYVHVCDLASAHLLALDAINRTGTLGAINLGGEHEHTVREVLSAVEKVTGLPVPHEIGKRRPGDPPVLVANSRRAREVLGWRPERSDLPTIVEDALRSRRDGWVPR